jgi:tRNA modification GTPase
MNLSDTIAAISTPAGSGAIAVIRISGSETEALVRKIFRGSSGVWNPVPGRVILGNIFDREEMLDEVLLTWFRAPHSYTGDNLAEISCHGSSYLQQRLMQLILASGARMAEPGEFTFRAFMNGKMDLTQAEGVADLIVSATGYQHKLALQQMRGGISEKLKELRGKLLEFSALLELELDFSLEDVEFADRTSLSALLTEIVQELGRLLSTFRQGNALKHGIPVTIAGRPNSGKSTLLNALLDEEKAIVSEIPGTTRDAIEDTLTISGIPFRFIDTAGLRTDAGEIEGMGIEKTWQKIHQAAIILYLFDTEKSDADSLKREIDLLYTKMTEIMTEEELAGKSVVLVGNKIDKLTLIPAHYAENLKQEVVFISARQHTNLSSLTDVLLKCAELTDLQDKLVITSLRHYQSLEAGCFAVNEAIAAMDSGLPSDLVATDIRQALYHIGLITGEISTDELLGNIFGKFCIGK